jgi:hypothetical protein
MAQPLPDTLDISDFDMHRPCEFCGSAECDPDEMDVWVTHMVTWHGYTILKDTPGDSKGERPRVITLKQVGWSEHARFQANQRVSVKAGVMQREFAHRKGTVVGYNPSTSEFAVSFSEKPSLGVLLPADLELYVSAR